MRARIITRLWVLFAFISLFCMAQKTLASTSFSADSFDIYVGNFDGVAGDDIYLKAKEKVLILAPEISIPIVFTDSANLMIRNAYSLFPTPSIVVWTAAVNLEGLERMDADILIGDFNGDGISDLLLKSNDPSVDSLIVYGATGDVPTRLSVFDKIEGQTIYDRRIVVRDVNGDGRSDLQLFEDDNHSIIALASSTGAFSVAPSTKVPMNSTVVGATAGDFEVGPDGSANYTIPIAVAPGGAGMQPELAFTYNSGSGNGYMGMGWDVTQPSAISKCGTSFIEDGYIEADKYFCLDGNRLVDVSASFSAASGTVFYPSNADFSKVEKLNNDSFAVYYKSGEIAYFGNYLSNNPNARQAEIGLFHLARIEDRAGNARVYDYFKNSSGEHYLTHIRYPGGEVEFKYTTVRGDHSESLNNGYRTRVLNRLSRVESRVDSTRIYRSYDLTYNPSPVGGQSRLSQLKECGADGSCLKPTIFYWSEITSINFRAATTTNFGSVAGGNTWAENPYFLDMNGDGFTDILTAKNGLLYLRLGNGAGSFREALHDSVEWNWGEAGVVVTTPSFYSNITNYWQNAKVADLDGDGKPEIIVPNVVEGKWQAIKAYNNANFIDYDGGSTQAFGSTRKQWFYIVDVAQLQISSEFQNQFHIFADLNGDALADALPVRKPPSSTYYSQSMYLNGTGFGFNLEHFLTAYDPNARYGADYVAWLKAGGFYSTICNFVCGPAFIEAPYASNTGMMNRIPSTEGAIPKNTVVMDIDGDGKSDILRSDRKSKVSPGSTTLNMSYVDEGMYWFKGSIRRDPITGVNHFVERVTNAKVYNVETARAVDINGDGLDDLAYNRDGKWAYNINTGGDFGPSVLTNAIYREKAQFFDYNDDGRSDILYVSGGNWVVDLFNGYAGDLNGVTDCFWCFDVGQNTNITASAADDRFQFGEFDGDGLLDVITYSGTQWRVFTRNSGGLPTYMTTVTNGMGLKTRFVYGQLFDTSANASFYQKGAAQTYPAVNISGGMRVVQSVEVEKAATNTGSNAALLKDIVSYNYSQLVVHQKGLGSLGFRTITATTPLTQTVTTYSQDWARRTHGMAESVRVRKRASPTLTTWRDVSLTQNTNVSLTSTQSSKIRYTFTGKTVETEYDVTATSASTVLKRVTTEYGPDTVLSASQTGFNFSTALYNTTGLVTSTGVFDITQDFGNMVAVKVVTSNAAATESHTVLTTSHYNDENPSEWIIGRVSDTTVVSSGTGRTTKTRNSSWDYYPDGYLSSETIAPNDGYLEQTTSYTYNSFGLKETVTVSGDDVTSRSSTTYYDSDGRYPVRVVNALGAVETDYDPVLGLPTSVTDINGLTSYSSYDGFGRPRVTTNPDGTWQQTTFHAGDIGPRSGTSASSKSHHSLSSLDVATASVCSTCAERRATYVVVIQDQTGAWTETFFDLVGNEFEKRSLDRFDNSRIVATRTEYDTYGDAVRTSEPYALSTGPQYWTSVVQKDILGRPLRVRNPEGKSVSYLYAGFDTTVTNELGKTKKDSMTVDGKLGAVTDHDGNRVTYAYDGSGNMTGMTDPGANGYTTTIVYDNRGSKTSMNDPNKGNWSYAYNAFGELILQTDAEGKKTCQAYDNLGRMTLRVDNFGGIEADARSSCSNPGSGEITRWFYDTAANGKGKLARVEGPNGFVETFEYDELGRPTSNTRVIAGQSYTTKSAYDLQSRPVGTTYPSGLSVFNVYNNKGVLTQINKSDFNVAGAYYWKLIMTDHRGQPVGENMASGLMERATAYTPARGFVNSIDTGAPAGGKTAQWDLATYDELGNVKWRQNAVANSEETAGYDNLNRLRTIDRKINGVSQPTESMTYAANGNIATKWNVSGTYGYGGTCNGIKAGPHAVTSAAGNTYCYDRNGNMLSGAGRTVTWNSAGLPTEMARGTVAKAQFEYGPDRNRIRRLDYSNNVLTATTTYVGSYEKVVKGSVIEERHYIGGVAVVTKKTNGATVTIDENYLLKDNLGSVVNTVDIKKWFDDPSYIGDRGGFDATGMRRNANWTVKPLSELYLFKSVVTDRGYTGHEQIDEVGLIHMNGRVYDPILGRFISADPIIQDPTDLQSLNRYTYVRNNPLSMTDPSGFSWFSKQWKKWGKDLFLNVVTMGSYSITKSAFREFGRFARKNKYVAEIVQIAGCAAITISTGGAGAAGCAALSAAVTYGVTDGDFKAAMTAGAIAFITASISQGIGGSGWGIEGRVLAHGMVGGTMSVAQGGKFGAGFAGSVFGAMAGGFAQGVGNGTGFLAVAARTTVAALVGGTASKLSGGSFANGARTAAMQHLFNAEAHALKEHVLSDAESYIGRDDFKNAKGEHQCVEFAQQAGKAPLTKDWVAGDTVTENTPKGTWVGTFGSDGKYTGHIGAFHSLDAAGNLTLIDQFNRKGEVGYTTYRAKPAGYTGRISNDPSKYRTVKW